MSRIRSLAVTFSGVLPVLAIVVIAGRRWLGL
jgi:hypothetical protein